MTIATPAAAETDFILQDAGGIVTFGNQSGYGILESPDTDVTDTQGMRLRGYARVLVVREGAFTGLAEDQPITYAGLAFLIRDLGNAGATGLRRLAVTRATPVDHLTVNPSSLFVAVGGTSTLTATLYDVAGNVLSGRVVTWSTSNPSIIRIDPTTGVATGIGVGSCTLTATSEGKSASVTAVCALALSYSLDWSPLVRRADLAQPLAFVSDVPRGAGDGYQLNLPKLLGCNTMGSTRVAFPKSATEWGTYTPIDAPMSNAFIPNVSFGNRAAVTGPYDNTTAWQIDPTDAFGHNCNLGIIWSLGDATNDRQDYATYKRSMACRIRAKTAADVGKTVRINAVDSALVPGGSGWWSTNPAIKYVDVVLTLVDQPIVITFDSQAQFNGITPTLVVSMPSNTAPLASYIVSAYTSTNWQAHETNDDSNWLRPLPFHETLGLLSQFQHRNSWGPSSDSPTLYGGASSVSSAVVAPDDGRHYGGRTMNKYTLPNGGGFTTDAPYRCEHLTDIYPSNEPTGAVWLMAYIRPNTTMPADGALVGYVTPRGNAVLDTFTRADTTSGMGTSNTGQTWNEITGTWGISSNQAYLPSGVGQAVIDSGKADATIQVTWIAAALGTQRPRLIFRCTDANNYWFIDPVDANTLQLYKNVAGGSTQVGSNATHAWASGDVVKVVTSGNSISVYINGVLAIGPVTDSFNASATSHGIGVISNGASLRFDDFSVQADLTPYGPVNLVRDSASILRQSDGGSFYRCRIPVNLASEGYLDFTPKIQNSSGGSLTFYATRCAMVAESPRSAGWHNAWVPKRTVTAPALSEASWSEIGKLAALLNNHEGVWVIRCVPAFALGACHNLNGNGGTSNPDVLGPGFWQSGPFGSADYSFDGSVNPTASGIDLVFRMERGAPAVGSWTSWNATISFTTDDPTRFPAFKAIDIALAWKGDQIVAFGIGEGVGTSITWLANGDTYNGGAVSISSQTAQVWQMSDADSHLGIGADRDRIRQFGGWVQAIAAASAVNPATVKDSIGLQIATRFGARGDYR